MPLSSVLPLLWFPFGHSHRLPGELRRAVDETNDRVLEELLVVPFRIVVRARVRTTALLPFDAGDDHGLGEVEQKAELDRLRQIAVEHLALVVDHHAPVAVAKPGHDLPLLLHLTLPTEDAEVLVHRAGELVANAPRPLTVVALEQRRQLSFRV